MFDAEPREKLRESYRTSSKEKLLADKVQRNILSKGIYTNNRGIKPESFYVLRKTRSVTVLMKLSFITNHTDLDIVLKNKKEFANAAAEAAKNI